MGVNIFTGGRAGAPSKSKTGKTSAVLGTPSKIPTTVAINKQGILGKVAGFAKKALPSVASILPGPMGAIAKGLSSVFNDPEWWESIPGLGMATNLPLIESKGTVIDADGESKPIYYDRFAILEIASGHATSNSMRDVCDPDINSVTQYLMTEVRKVVNAVPLQSSAVYGDAFARNCGLYAYWRYLKKIDYLMKEGKTYLPNLNDPGFPIFLVENAPILQSTLLRLEEILRSSVRLPHTMCEYLTWRYGRIYKSNTSAKSGLVMYNPISLMSSMEELLREINRYIDYPSSSVGAAQAVVDLYNAYGDHSQAVEIGDDTQFAYDAKEFLLRTNLDVDNGTEMYDDYSPHIVILDSELDNPTTFMSSTISTHVKYSSGKYSALFPVNRATAYIAGSSSTDFYPKLNKSTYWSRADLSAIGVNDANLKDPILVRTMLGRLMAAKALDYYMGDLCYGKTDAERHVLTPLSMDAGFVNPEVLANTQLHAFGNLLYANRKVGASKAIVAKQVAGDVAKMVAETTSSNVAVKAN